jgi:hypothetical protein
MPKRERLFTKLLSAPDEVSRDTHEGIEQSPDWTKDPVGRRKEWLVQMDIPGGDGRESKY